ncbi:EAL domain-containing protein [Bacillus sp. 31A1R]|uniref:EAL domain-containing protein n=1 Tax=Robertmurraya mangrovi TaxID=3098077 RepID=A0ABU5ITB3_9BACI|nr:EAL domain-containing protein [Bacillus sp. 31A1R]MDZ5470371.1 EAL domain-containing protein [Bacillus sp. 31A1R]
MSLFMEKQSSLIDPDIPMELESRREFRSIILNRNLRMLFQPIVNLTDGTIFGYEGLTRGPKNSRFHSPLELFGYAEQSGSLYALEKTTRELAIKHSPTLLNNNEKLFININSQVVHDPDFTPGHTIQLLKQYNLSPSNVVFEITERSAIEDFTAFREVLNHYRAQGFKIAVDDAGAGYSSLQAISEIMPDFIKVDRSLISDIHQNDIKINILDAFVTFAKKMKSTIIAEGIEKSEELKKVIELGIDCGQGFYLAQPNYPVMEIPNFIKEEISHTRMFVQPETKTHIVGLNDTIIIMDKHEILKKSIVNRLL